MWEPYVPFWREIEKKIMKGKLHGLCLKEIYFFSPIFFFKWVPTAILKKRTNYIIEKLNFGKRLVICTTMEANARDFCSICWLLKFLEILNIRKIPMFHENSQKFLKFSKTPKNVRKLIRLCLIITFWNYNFGVFSMKYFV
jgi:hypothetical protein